MCRRLTVLPTRSGPQEPLPYFPNVFAVARLAFPPRDGLWKPFLLAFAPGLCLWLSWDPSGPSPLVLSLWAFWGRLLCPSLFVLPAGLLPGQGLPRFTSPCQNPSFWVSRRFLFFKFFCTFCFGLQAYSFHYFFSLENNKNIF